MSACLYRVRDADGSLVYVGFSMSAAQRLSAHASNADWWNDAHTVEVEHFSSRAAARLAETEAIRTENPRCNLLRPGMKRKPRKPRKRHEWVVVTLSPPVEHHEFLRSIAGAQQRSIGGQVRFMVAQLRAQVEEPA